MPTARNARGIDIVAYSVDAQVMRALQVKSLTRKIPVPLGPDLDRAMGDFWLIVTGAQSDNPETFVLTPQEVRDRAHRGERNGKVSHWLQPGQYDDRAFRGAWDRIGDPHGLSSRAQ